MLVTESNINRSYANTQVMTRDLRFDFNIKGSSDMNASAVQVTVHFTYQNA